MWNEKMIIGQQRTKRVLLEIVSEKSCTTRVRVPQGGESKKNLFHQEKEIERMVETAITRAMVQ